MALPDLSSPDAMVALAIEALQKQQEEQAIPIVAEAAARHPGHARLWQMLGSLHRALDDLAAAIPAYQRSLDLAPDDPASAHMLARSRLEAGLPATAAFERAMALAPADDIARAGAASALLADSGPAAAEALLERSLAERPLWIEGHAQLARLRWASGDRAGFVRSFEAALARAPREVNLWGQYLASLALAFRHEAVLAAVGRARAAAGRQALFDLYEATALDELGRLDASAPLFAALASVNDPIVNIYRVRHLLRARRDGEAAALAEQWAATPYGAHFLPYLSLAWRLTGDPRWPWLEGDERLVGVYDLGEALGPVEALAAVLRGLHVAADQPLDQSVRGGTQVAFVLSRIEPEIRRARSAIMAAALRHVAQLPPRDPGHPVLAPPRGRPPRLSGSWSVRLAGEGHHVSHVHPGGWFSSAFYAALPGEAERGPAPAGWLALGAPPEELGLGLQATRLIEPRPGRLVLFPSTMWHGTLPFAVGERLTLAFDIVPSGEG